MTAVAVPSPRSAAVGSPVPRLWTPPLRELTPETSYGFDVIDFARDVLEHPLDPWQEFAVIHGGELLPDGMPRFRHVLVIVARQNGKSEIPIVLGLFWMFVDEIPLILWTSTQLKYADEALTKAERVARRSPELSPLLPAKKWKRNLLGSSYLEHGDSRFMDAAANEEGGRSLTVHRLIQDELRQHRDYSAWGAAVPAMSAVPDAQAWHLSNAGSDLSLVLNEQRDAALAAIEEGDTATRTCLMEWSCPEDADPEDLDALAQANPGLGHHGPTEAELLGEARTAKRAGGLALAQFKTEKMCIRVRRMDPAIDPDKWRETTVEGDLSAVRSRVALCVDVSPDSRHATLAAAALVDGGKVRVEIVAAWDDTERLRRELPALVARIRPQVLGWFPGGPAASLAADLADRGARTWPPQGVKVEAIKGDVTSACMGMAEQVLTGQVLHASDPLLDAHVGAAEKLRQGDAWRFSRRGEGQVDAAYAASGAVHLARTLPQPVGKPRIVRAGRLAS